MTYTPLSPEEIRAAVLKEAGEQFFKHGIAGTQMKKIAEAVGIGRSTLYRYYTEKDQLTFHITSRIIADITSRALAKAGENKRAKGFEQLRIFFEGYIGLLMSNIEILNYFTEFDRLYQGKYPEFQETRDFVNTITQFTVSTSQFISRGIEDGSIVTEEDPMALAAVFLNAVVGTSQRVLPRSEHYYIEHGVSGEDIVHKVLKCLLNSIKG